MTPLDIITAAMQDLGALSLEETLSAAEGAAGLASLNDMIGAWNTENLLVFSIVPQVFNTIAGQPSFTYGVGGNFNAARPAMIYDAFWRDGNGQDTPIYYTTNYSDYAGIPDKTYTSLQPAMIYDDGSAPSRNLYVYPVPQGIYQIVLWVDSVITSFNLINDTINLPPAYARALKKNLALEFAPAYGRQPSQMLVKQAMDSKAQIARLNVRMDEMAIPLGIPQRGRYNIYTNGYYNYGAY